MEIVRKEKNNKDFLKLIKELDEYLYKTYGKVQLKYGELNKVDNIYEVVLLYIDSKPIGCGAYKEYNNYKVEIKRVFIKEEYRGKGYSKFILAELENAIREKNYKCIILETGKKQINAINLYMRCGYEITDNYGEYKDNDNSICMIKYI